MANDLDFDELDKAVSGYMQRRKRGSAQAPAPTDNSSPPEPTSASGNEFATVAPSRPAVSVPAKPQGHHAAPSIHLEPRRSLTYREDIIHDIAPPRPLPPRTSRTLNPFSPSSRVSEDERPASKPEKVEVAHHDHNAPLFPLSGHGDHGHGERHVTPDHLESSKKGETGLADEPVKQAADGMGKGAISDALAEDLGKEKKTFEAEETAAADNLPKAPAPEVDLPNASEVEEREEEVKAEAKPLHESAKKEAGSKPLDEPDRLLPEGPHSMASPSTPQVPRDETDHSVDLFDTKQYHTPLSTAPAGKAKQQSSSLKWILIIVLCLAIIGLGAYYYLAYVKK